MFSERFDDIDKISKEVLKEKNMKLDADYINKLQHHIYTLYRNVFYSYVYFNSTKPKNVILALTVGKIDEICTKCNAKKKEIETIKKVFRKYLSMEEKQKEIFDRLLFDEN